jgi:hypothetical protein
MEDGRNFVANGRRPQSFGKLKTTSMEDDLKFLFQEDILQFFLGKADLSSPSFS